jgi:crossover junction endodeoxyribonuclease RuvC
MNSSFILGIDPGLAHTGWGVIEVRGSQKSCLAYGCITTTPEDTLPSRLKHIYAAVDAAIETYHPTELGIESVYFGANSKSAIATGQARGAALVATANRGLCIGEYTPMQIKQTVAGTGAADKEQVQYMVRAILGLDHLPRPDHAADALAAAITHANFRSSVESVRISASTGRVAP